MHIKAASLKWIVDHEKRRKGKIYLSVDISFKILLQRIAEAQKLTLVMMVVYTHNPAISELNFKSWSIC